MSERSAYLLEDKDSFAAPRKRALAECVAAFAAASKPVRGSEARLAAALADLDSFSTFDEQVGRLLEKRSFQSLPGFKRGPETLDGLHHLTVGPWRGVFLVRPDGSEVVGLVFSKHPHKLEERLDELVAGYRPRRAE